MVGILTSILRDPWLTTMHDRARVAGIMLLVECIKTCERLRLRFGGTPSR